jgi:SAM-dependent methyltransferase
VKSIDGVDLSQVTSLYAGAQGALWELLLGQQIHIGGMKSSMELADLAGIGAGMRGVDLCCGNGAGMRLLVRFRNVASMVGVDATESVVERGRRTSGEEGFTQRIQFVCADACQSGLPSASADFVWGEDAWCYAADKAKLIAEVARIVRPGGLIAFTDWVEGAAELSNDEASRFLGIMRFANVEDIDGYTRLLERNGCEVLIAEDTRRFGAYLDLFVNMTEMQLTYDVLRVFDFNTDLLQRSIEGSRFLAELGRAGKIAQARFVVRRR